MAYQGYGRNLSIDLINNLIQFINCPKPNHSILLDISVEEGFSRKSNDQKDRIESSGHDFFNKVRQGYLKIAELEHERFTVIDASNDVNTISNKIISTINIK